MFYPLSGGSKSKFHSIFHKGRRLESATRQLFSFIVVFQVL